MSNDGITTIKPDCDPCENAEELLCDILTQIFEEVEKLERELPFAGFLDAMKPTLYKNLVKLLDDLAGCFTDGLPGLEVWLKKNMSTHFAASVPPQFRNNP